MVSILFSAAWLKAIQAPVPDAQRLSLSQVLRDVSVAFPKLISARLENDIAQAKAQEKRGAFDPVFSVENEFMRYNSSTTAGRARQSSMTQTTVEVLDRTGVKIAFGARYNTGSIKQPASSTGTLGEYFVSAKIPFIRDRLVNAKTISERQAILGIPLAQQSIREAQLSLFLKAGEVYWEWVGAGEKLEIARQVYKLAVDRAEFIKTRVQRGANPPIDNEEAQAEVFRRLGSLEKAERDLQKSEFKLQFFRWSENGNPAQTPPDRVTLPKLPEVSGPVNKLVLQKAREIAMMDRPELLGLNISKDILALDVDLARNERKPALDLAVGPSIDLGDDAISNPIKAGIFYSIPLRQNRADGLIALAILKVRKLELEEQQTRQIIALEVNDANSFVNQAYLRVLAAEKEVVASRALELGEQIRFTEGVSTLFLVNQRERARAEAESRLVDVKVEYQQAVLAFLFATAQLSPEKVTITP